MRNIQENLMDQVIAWAIILACFGLLVMYVAVTGGRGIGQRPEPLHVVASALGYHTQGHGTREQQAQDYARDADLPGEETVVTIQGHDYLCKPGTTVSTWRCTR